MYRRFYFVFFSFSFSIDTANGDMPDQPHEVKAYQFSPDQTLRITSQVRKKGYNQTPYIKVEFSNSKKPKTLSVFLSFRHSSQIFLNSVRHAPACRNASILDFLCTILNISCVIFDISCAIFNIMRHIYHSYFIFIFHVSSICM